MTTLDQAVTQMMAAGMPPFPPGHPLVNAGRIVRYGPKKKAWYRLYDFRANTGAYVVGGDYGMWGEIESRKIEIDWKGINQEERDRMRRERAEAEAREARKVAERSKFAAARARSQWESARSAKPAGIVTYLDRKGVAHEKGLRYLPDGTLLVPMIRYDITEAQESAPDYEGPRRLVGLQKIAPDGGKLFNKGMAKASSAFRLGRAPARGDLILLTEGVATGLSIRQAIKQKYAVFVAFDAGNLVPVAKILRTLYPQSPILVCADDDAYLAASMNRVLRENYGITEILAPPLTAKRVTAREGEVEVSADLVDDAHGVAGIVGAVHQAGRVLPFSRVNAGLVYAHRAANEAGNATVIYPRFAERTMSPDPDAAGGKLTDFNDLHIAESLGAVERQLSEEITRAEFSREVAKVVSIEVARLKRDTKAKASPDKPERLFDWDTFFDRFTLIYPTDTVYDAHIEQIAKLSTVKINFGDGVVKWWLQSPRRRTVNLDRVVFDPKGQYDPDTSVNLFHGLAPPAAVKDGASCEKLLELLQYLCGEADQDLAPVTDWVLNWLAYPLQHVGAKMASAIVMHGQDEGTGKNLFFNVIRDIYGRYGGMIMQTQLESPYNGWMSQRLFMIANEVVSRQELRHHVGRLKNLVTESPIPIEEKYMPMRYEDNHMNMVFLTNEFQALQISHTDRRYFIIYTPGLHTPAFYASVVAEIANGGGAALHRYLLDRELGEFNEHTKPIMTEAKENLIEIGLSSTQQFWGELHAGLIYPLEYCPALWNDLYSVYQVWCARNGVKNPRPSNYFGMEFMKMNGVKRETLRVADPDKPSEFSRPEDTWPQRSVYLMGQRSEAVPKSSWVRDGVTKFRRAARDYLRESGLRRQPQGSDFEGQGSDAN